MIQGDASVPDPKIGDVAYFYYLHLDTAEPVKKSSHAEDNCIFEVEGKARPMLIIREPQEEFGKKWYRVLPITTKDHGNRPGYLYIGKSIKAERESYLKLNPSHYPENLISFRNGRRCIVNVIDPLAIQHVLKIIGSLKLM